jgi:mannan endo-1,4-beta-mannosidase
MNGSDDMWDSPATDVTRGNVVDGWSVLDPDLWRAPRAGRTVVLANTDRAGRHREAPRRTFRTPVRRHWARLAWVIAVTSALAVIVSTFVMLGARSANHATHPPHPPHPPQPARSAALPTTPESYLGVYAAGAPYTYAGVTAFTTATGIRPRLVVYYSGWPEPFQNSFATTAAKHGAVPLVQMDPDNVSVAAIADGQYDAYLISYAKAVRAYRNPVILSFGHEMNGTWYSWGYQHTSPVTFVAAWRHIVDIFRGQRARNVTWMWTVNIIKTKDGQIPSPAPWWPGSSYVTWVGIDAYYLRPSWQFVPIFGPTIVAVRELTHDPILIAETSATRAANQLEKITNLFAGIHTYGLLGFVWFNAISASLDYRISGPEAIAALRQGAKTYSEPAS